jgi:hypothetical protein
MKDYSMDEHLEEVIKLAWKYSPSDTEYYLSKHIIDMSSKLNEVLKTMDLYERDNAEDGIYYNHCLDESESINKQLNRLTYLLSSLRGI